MYYPVGSSGTMPWVREGGGVARQWVEAKDKHEDGKSTFHAVPHTKDCTRVQYRKGNTCFNKRGQNCFACFFSPLFLASHGFQRVGALVFLLLLPVDAHAGKVADDGKQTREDENALPQPGGHQVEEQETEGARGSQLQDQVRKGGLRRRLEHVGVHSLVLALPHRTSAPEDEEQGGKDSPLAQLLSQRGVAAHRVVREVEGGAEAEEAAHADKHDRRLRRDKLRQTRERELHQRRRERDDGDKVAHLVLAQGVLDHRAGDVRVEVRSGEPELHVEEAEEQDLRLVGDQLHGGEDLLEHRRLLHGNVLVHRRVLLLLQQTHQRLELLDEGHADGRQHSEGGEDPVRPDHTVELEVLDECRLVRLRAHGRDRAVNAKGHRDDTRVVSLVDAALPRQNIAVPVVTAHPHKNQGRQKLAHQLEGQVHEGKDAAEVRRRARLRDALLLRVQLGGSGEVAALRRPKEAGSHPAEARGGHHDDPPKAVVREHSEQVTDDVHRVHAAARNQPPLLPQLAHNHRGAQQCRERVKEVQSTQGVVAQAAVELRRRERDHSSHSSVVDSEAHSHHQEGEHHVARGKMAVRRIDNIFLRPRLSLARATTHCKQTGSMKYRYCS
eukprot:Rhum_TRINITY_DN14767_c18_g1::Rhum_TRINITY_DN14767_c18_g1_i1::g.116942::m.116942